MVTGNKYIKDVNYLGAFVVMFFIVVVCAMIAYANINELSMHEVSKEGFNTDVVFVAIAGIFMVVTTIMNTTTANFSFIKKLTVAGMLVVFFQPTLLFEGQTIYAFRVLSFLYVAFLFVALNIDNIKSLETNTFSKFKEKKIRALIG